MKIENALKTEAPAKAKEPKGSKSRVLSQSTDQRGIHDEVALTGGATKLQELENRLAELEITDPKKVESIRQAIADGTFKVDEEAVADGLINETINHLRSTILR